MAEPAITFETLACRIPPVANLRPIVPSASRLDTSQYTELAKTLFEAVEVGDSRRVGQLLKSGADPEVESEDGWRPIHYAAAFGRELVLQLLLAKQVNVDAKVPGGFTPLMLAAQFGRDSIVRLLAPHVKDVDEPNDDGNTALVISCYHTESLPVVKALVEAGASVNRRVRDGATALMNAAEKGRVEIVRYLLDEGASPNLVSERNSTALALAVQDGMNEVVELLLTRGANPNQAAGPNDWFPLMFAAANGQYEAAEILLKYGARPKLATGDGLNALMAAINSRRFDIASLLIGEGADPNYRFRGSPLLAIYAGQPEEDFATVEFLLANGSDLNLADAGGHTALHNAIEYRNYDIALLLIDRNCDLNRADSKGRTPLLIAVNNRAYGLAKKLIDKGADKDRRTPDGQTLIGFSLVSNRIDMAELLLEEKSDLNRIDAYGCTTLRLAIEKDNFEIAEKMLRAGAEINYIDLKTWLFYENIKLIQDHRPSLYNLLMDRLEELIGAVAESARVPRSKRDEFLRSVRELLARLAPESDDVPERIPDAAPELYRDRPKGETAPDFLRRVWGKYLDAGILYQDDLRRLDAPLLDALNTYCRTHNLDRRTILPPPRQARTDKVLATAPEGSAEHELARRRMLERQNSARRRGKPTEP